MILKRDTQTHDLSGADATIEMAEKIGDKKTFTCQLSWENVDDVDTVITLQGSNDKVNFDDLGVQKILTTSSGSATLTDADFPHDFGFVDIQKNSSTTGIIKFKFIAK